MPASLIKSFAKKIGKSTKEVDRLWKKAKEAAAKQGRSEDWKYVVGILKKALSVKESCMRELIERVLECG